MGISALADSLKMESIKVDAPFKMPAITIPDFSGCPEFSIKDLGAKPGDKDSTTKAISEAISKAHKAGGGTIVVPAGDWLTGNISKGVLGIATDVLYQWKNLVPTYEKRLTPIQDVFLENINVGNMRYIASIKASKELPVRNISLSRINAGTVKEEPWKISNVENLKRDQVEFTPVK